MTEAFPEQLSFICSLQEIDLNLHNLQRQLDELPSRITDIEAAYIVVKEELNGVRGELSAVESAKRTDETDLAVSVEHMRTREAKLYAIKTNKEYQAALKEIAEGKRHNKEREDRILTAMEKIEELNKKNTQLSTAFADKEVELKNKQEEIKSEELKIRESMKGDEARRPEVVAKLDKAIFRKYEFVRQRHAIAVARVENGICKGCSTRVPPQLYNELLKKKELRVCPSCQRLIYVGEIGDENGKK